MIHYCCVVCLFLQGTKELMRLLYNSHHLDLQRYRSMLAVAATEKKANVPTYFPADSIEEKEEQQVQEEKEGQQEQEVNSLSKDDCQKADGEMAEFVVRTCLCLHENDGGGSELRFVAPIAIQEHMNQMQVVEEVVEEVEKEKVEDEQVEEETKEETKIETTKEIQEETAEETKKETVDPPQASPASRRRIKSTQEKEAWVKVHNQSTSQSTNQNINQSSGDVSEQECLFESAGTTFVHNSTGAQSHACSLVTVHATTNATTDAAGVTLWVVRITKGTTAGTNNNPYDKTYTMTVPEQHVLQSLQVNITVPCVVCVVVV